MFSVARTFDRHATNLNCLGLGFIVRHVCARYTFGDFVPNPSIVQSLLNASLYLYTMHCFVRRNIFTNLNILVAIFDVVGLADGISSQFVKWGSVGVQIAAHNGAVGR